jgi:hypothetical protein
MRQQLEDLLSNTVGLMYTLPLAKGSIPKIAISTQNDECYSVLSSDDDLAKVIYNGIIDYSYEESQIDLTKLDVFQKRALKTKLKFTPTDSQDKQLGYGFYGEILLFLLLQKFHKVGTFISRGHFYSPLENSETKGYDTYQMILNPKGQTELWFGEVKFHKDFRTGITQILDKIEKSLSDEYFGDNILAMEDYESFVNPNVTITPLLEAFRADPDINLAALAHKYRFTFVYPMLVIFDDAQKSYDDIIKDVVRYTNKKWPKLNIKFSLNYSLFFIFLPVKTVKNIKIQVRSWIMSNEPLI